MGSVQSNVLSVGQSRRRTQPERRASTRSALLAAAARAVVEHGPATCVADIARRAGVSTGALQYHFDSKSDLLVAVVEAGWNDLVERSMAADRSGTVRERVAALVGAMWESFSRPGCRAAFTISSNPSLGSELSSGITPIFGAVRERLDQLWQEVFADVGLPAERVVLARRFVRSHISGMAVQRHMVWVEPDPREELDLLVDATMTILVGDRAGAVT